MGYHLCFVMIRTWNASLFLEKYLSTVFFFSLSWFISFQIFIMFQLFMFSIYKYVDNWTEIARKYDDKSNEPQQK